ncbi:hypothetical protein RO21_03660 [[Actinobacillus] muris]|uniref:Uncharacterized protein n=1 Tax=Muribacter muris TaxID=67855 RepID=A0A0J5P838_9PAST|nr:hypothetical protein [Muribacter muris]KMK51930.1 hypothetical protein RO21_03660 [[Actinobacillus] muris] [Muribacter muris]
MQAQLDDSRHQRKKAEVGNLTDSNALFHLARNRVLEPTVEACTEELSLLKTDLQVKAQVLDHMAREQNTVYRRI